MFKPGDLIKFKPRILKMLLDDPHWDRQADMLMMPKFVLRSGVARKPFRNDMFQVVYLVCGKIMTAAQDQFELVDQ